MSVTETDLSNCDRELIRVPGFIQPHGFLLVLSGAGMITFCSTNAYFFLTGLQGSLTGANIDRLGSLLHETFVPGDLPRLLEQCRSPKFLEEVNPRPVSIGGRPFHLIISRLDDQFMLEFERAEQVTLNLQAMITYSINRISVDRRLPDLYNSAARQVREIIGFDRVMIYRFAPDGHGEVVAEAKGKELESLLGLHYPASDIPKQARELYKLNLT